MARNRADVRRQNEAISLAWHTAAFTRTQKKLPSLDSLLIKKEGRRQTWQQQLLVAHQWVAKNGGKIRNKVN